MSRNPLQNQILGILAAHPEGLSAPELRARLRPRPSQPTLSRRLMDLRARGLVARTGAARATRYFFTEGRHRLAELRSQALHQAVAEKLVQQPALVERALENLETLKRRNPSGHRYHQRWEQLLRGDRTQLLRVLTADSEEARALRQETPFAGILRAHERRRIFDQFKSA